MIARTLALLEEARRTAASGRIPPPLVDSPKCSRCSLSGICLPDEVNLLRRFQFAAAVDPDVCRSIARAFGSGKVRNCRTLLRRNARELPDSSLKALAVARRDAERAESLSSLLGIEGNAAREYFAAFSLMFKGTEAGEAPAFDFRGRNRRPPRDPVNALLSFVYAMLVKDLVAAVVAVGFDPYLGFYHQPRYGRPARAL